ncbi:MAG: CCA tRNA nucleotidyltransferase [Spirochaetes bacterium]|nr:CCA tRNA nucleotidyltransferase [Spirochaetota bacterium]
MEKIKKKFRIDHDFLKAIKRLIATLNEAGYECFMVGGSVRDMLLGMEVYDFDFATNAKPEKVVELFNHVVPTGIKHGTVTVLFGKKAFEVTTYRCDGKYFDGRRPENITYSETLEEDVARRDFTINGLAYDFEHEEVIDYVGGLKDLNEGIIRTIGSAIDRLNEDGLRSYRACRFTAKLNFIIEKNSFEAIKKTLHVSEKVSVERVREELMKMLETDKPSIGIENMRHSGLLKIALPELQQCFGVPQNKYHKYDVYYHNIYSCDAAPKNQPYIRLAALFHDIGKVATRRTGSDGDGTFYNHEMVGGRITESIMKRLKFSNDDISKTVNLVMNHMFHYTDDWNDGAVRRFMRKVGIENIQDLIQLRLADRRGNGSRDGIPAPITELCERIEKVIADENAITVKDLEITGYDVMKHFKVEPGPVIGIILNELLEIVLDHPEHNNKDYLIAEAENLFSEAVEKAKLVRKTRKQTE